MDKDISSESDNLGSNAGSSMSFLVSYLSFQSLKFSSVKWTHNNNVFGWNGLAFVQSVFCPVLSWCCSRLWVTVVNRHLLRARHSPRIGIIAVNKMDKVPVLMDPFIPADYED